MVCWMPTRLPASRVQDECSFPCLPVADQGWPEDCLERMKGTELACPIEVFAGRFIASQIKNLINCYPQDARIHNYTQQRPWLEAGLGALAPGKILMMNTCGRAKRMGEGREFGIPHLEASAKPGKIG